eukprot:TRINITY_DN4835_c0_g1_i2.p1 TRINITY_DN4835_c0_g1~~TRINITY_DN4835_c0_g1_i2.p1  ORF type:complete len:470 (+),score=64.04 TRINITY_DN4835_c0_g1_i2:67-1476(+)
MTGTADPPVKETIQESTIETVGMSMEELQLELLLQDSPQGLHAMVRRCGTIQNLLKEIVNQLRRPSNLGHATTTGVAGCEHEDLVCLGERATDLEELEELMRRRWRQREEQQAALRKALTCGFTSPSSLLRGLTRVPSKKLPAGAARCQFNEILFDADFKCLRPETADALMEELQMRVHTGIDVNVEGAMPVLATAPHNLYLLRDGDRAHLMEMFTTNTARRIAKTLHGASISWTRSEQRRSELRWWLGRATCENGGEMGEQLDRRNRDPNYLTSEEVMGNPWFRQVLNLAEGWRRAYGDGNPMLHIDIHGCKDPPASPSHITIGLAAMRREAERERSLLPHSRIDAFSKALEDEILTVLSGVTLRPRDALLVRVLAPDEGSSTEPLERFSGAWAVKHRRLTQSQQAVTYAGFTHSCQVELSKSVRQVLHHDEMLTARFARALHGAWLSTTTSRGSPGTVQVDGERSDY